MHSLREIMASHKRSDALGGRTPEENAAYWRERWAAGTGVVWPDGPRKARAHEIVPEAYDVREHLGRCAVPSRLVDVIAAGPEQTAVVQATRTWLEGDKSLLLLHGETGGGKSLAAATVFLAARETFHWDGGEVPIWDSAGCMFLAASALSRGSYFDDEGKALVAHAKKVRLLVLDELGAELISAPYMSTFDEILTERFGDRRKRTVLTSNISARRAKEQPTKPSPFEERYGARVARRIRESGTVVAVEPRT